MSINDPAHDAEYYEWLADNTGQSAPFRIEPSTEIMVERSSTIWHEYCAFRKFADPLDTLRKAGIKDIKVYMHWYLDKHKVKTLDALWVTMRIWRMMYAYKLRIRVDLAVASEMKNYIATTLREQYRLTESKKDKPVITVDDLFQLFHHHWTVSTAYYHTERDRLQHALIMLLTVYTSARPSILIETPAYKGVNASMRYKDIELLVVCDPQDRNRRILIMRLRLRLFKGRRNRGVAPLFVFHQRLDVLAFDTIQYVLALAFADRAFLSEWIKTPDDISKIDIPPWLDCIPLEWKPSMAEQPILRRAEKTEHGWKTSETAGVDYNTVTSDTRRLADDAGHDQEVTLYAMRRGAGKAVNRVATTAVQNQIMGHRDSSTFDKYYTAQVVGADIVSAYLGKPSQDAILQLAGRASLKRDPRAKAIVRSRVVVDVEQDLELKKLCKEVASLKFTIMSQHGRIKGCPRATDYAGVRNKYSREKKKLERLRTKAQKKKYFAEYGSQEIDRQRRGEPTKCMEEPPKFQFPEREVLASLLCRNDDVDAVPEEDLQSRRRVALDNMISLCSRAEAPRAPSNKRSTTPEGCKDRDLLEAGCQALQCPWCFHNESKPTQARTENFARADTLVRHVMKQHLQHKTYGVDSRCPFRYCNAAMLSETCLKVHFEEAHQMKLPYTETLSWKDEAL